MKGYYIFTRCSTEEQRRQGSSHENQATTVQNHPRTRGQICFGVFSETITGRSEKRPVLDDLYNTCSNPSNNVKNIWVYRWDRLARNPKVAHQYIEKFQGIGVEINSVDQYIDIHAGATNTMLGLFLGMAADESEIISRRTRLGNYQTMLNGYWVHSCPAGYIRSNEVDSNNKRLCVPRPEAKWLTIGLQKFVTGEWTQADVTRKWVKEKIVNVKSAAYNIWKDANLIFYSGRIYVRKTYTNPARIVQGKHEAIISIDLAERVMEILRLQRANQRKSLAVLDDKTFPLKSLLVHECGRKFVAYTSKGRKKYYSYYSCQKCKVIIRQEMAETVVANMLKELEITEETHAELSRLVRSKLQVERSKTTRQLNETKAALEKMRNRLKSLNEKFLDNLVDTGTYQSLKAEIEMSIVELEQRISKFELLKTSDDDLLLQVLDAIRNLSDLYYLADTQGKRNMLRGLFPDGFDLVLKNGAKMGKVRTAKQWRVRTAHINPTLHAMCR